MRCRSLPLVSLACWVALAAVPSLAGAQRVGLPVETALEDLRRAYRTETFSDHVTISVQRDSAPGRIVEDLRISGGRRLTDDSRRVRIDLNVLDVYAIAAEARSGDGDEAAMKATVLVTSDRDDSRYVRREFDGDLTARTLERIIPPLPTPQLDLAFSDQWPPTRFTPYAEEIRWTEAWLPNADRGVAAHLSGEFANGTVRVVIDVDSGRLRRFSIRRDDLAMTIEGEVRDAREADPSGWTLDAGGRDPVERVADLRRRAALLEVGDRSPDLGLLLPGGRPFVVREGEGARAVAIICVRESDDEARDACIAALGAVGASVGETAAPVGALVVRPGRAGLAERLSAWQDSIGGASMLWSPSPESSIERIARGTSLGVVVIDGAGVVRDSFDAGAMSADDIAARVKRALETDGAGG